MTPTYFILSLGCAMNAADGERVATVLEEVGYKKATSEKTADILVAIACSVRQKAVDRLWGKLQGWKKIKAKRNLTTILTGCVLPKDQKTLAAEFDLYLDVKNIHKLKDELASLPSPIFNDLNKKDLTRWQDDLSVPPLRSDKLRALVPIMTGCNAFCSYCAVPFTRGRERSRNVADVLNEVEELVMKKNYKEITLLGQIINKYRVELRPEDEKIIAKWLKKYPPSEMAKQLLADPIYVEKKQLIFPLLLALLDSLPKKWWLRFMSSHPYWFNNMLMEVVAQSEHIPHLFHLPLQAGSNNVLKSMLRPYTIEQYREAIKKIHSRLPDSALTTDIIVGFCGETEKDFTESEKVFKEFGYVMAYIARFSPRQHSAAWKLPDTLTWDEKGEREASLEKILRKTAKNHNEKHLGEIMTVLPINHKKTADGYLLGKNCDNVTINFKADKLPNDFISVKIELAEPFGLYGSIVGNF